MGRRGCREIDSPKQKRWLTTTIFLSVTCYNVTMIKQDYYNDFFEFGQQKINFSFFELSLPDDDPVYTLKKVMEELDFSGLLDTIDALYAKYNTFLQENGYGPKYDLGDARLFVIEGMEKVRRVTAENWKRKPGLLREKISGLFMEKDKGNHRSSSFMKNWKNAGNA